MQSSLKHAFGKLPGEVMGKISAIAGFFTATPAVAAAGDSCDFCSASCAGSCNNACITDGPKAKEYK
jgi:hypothetical protein